MSNQIGFISVTDTAGHKQRVNVAQICHYGDSLLGPGSIIVTPGGVIHVLAPPAELDVQIDRVVDFLRDPNGK